MKPVGKPVRLRQGRQGAKKRQEVKGLIRARIGLRSSSFSSESSSCSSLASWRPWRRTKRRSMEGGGRHPMAPTPDSLAPPSNRTPLRPGEAAGTLLLHLILVALAFIALVPFVWLVCACFKTQADIFAFPFLPWGHLDSLTLQNFPGLFRREPYC